MARICGVVMHRVKREKDGGLSAEVYHDGFLLGNWYRDADGNESYDFHSNSLRQPLHQYWEMVGKSGQTFSFYTYPASHGMIRKINTKEFLSMLADLTMAQKRFAAMKKQYPAWKKGNEYSLVEITDGKNLRGYCAHLPAEAALKSGLHQKALKEFITFHARSGREITVTAYEGMRNFRIG